MRLLRAGRPLSERGEPAVAAHREPPEGLPALGGKAPEGGGALQGGSAGPLPRRPVVGHGRGDQIQGLLQGAPQGPRPVGHVGLGHRQLIPEVVHGPQAPQRRSAEGVHVGLSPPATLRRTRAKTQTTRAAGEAVWGVPRGHRCSRSRIFFLLSCSVFS